MYAVPEMDVLSSAAFYMLVFLEMPAFSFCLSLRKICGPDALLPVFRALNIRKLTRDATRETELWNAVLHRKKRAYLPLTHPLSIV